MPTQENSRRFRISQSMLGTWMTCPLQAKFQYLDRLPRKQSAAATFGTCIHHALERYNLTADMEDAVSEFIRTWEHPEVLRAEPETWPKGTSFGGYRNRGIAVIRAYHQQLKWESRNVLATEHRFSVPLGEFDLVGFVDLVELRRSGRGKPTLRIVDYKTNKRAPTKYALALNIQFTAYWYASLQPEFWLGRGTDYPPMSDGASWWEQLHDAPRSAIWYHLETQKERDAGPRDDADFMRMYRACQEIKRAVEHEVFVPNISADSCNYCDFKEPCGLPIPQDASEGMAWI